MTHCRSERCNCAPADYLVLMYEHRTDGNAALRKAFPGLINRCDEVLIRSHPNKSLPRTVYAFRNARSDSSTVTFYAGS